MSFINFWDNILADEFKFIFNYKVNIVWKSDNWVVFLKFPGNVLSCVTSSAGRKTSLAA